MKTENIEVLRSIENLAAFIKYGEGSNPSIAGATEKKRCVKIRIEAAVREGTEKAFRAGYKACENGKNCDDDIIAVESIIGDIIDTIGDAMEELWKDLKAIVEEGWKDFQRIIKELIDGWTPW